MKQTTSNKKVANISKKKTRAHIKETLETALASLLPVLGKKKFSKRIKKAEKVLLRNVNGTIKINTSHTAKRNSKKVNVEQ